MSKPDDQDTNANKVPVPAEDLAALKEQLARVMTDNEAVVDQNTKLEEENTVLRKQAQEFGDLNDLLIRKAQRLEQDLVEMGKQRDTYREGFDKMTRKNAALMERLERQKMLENEPVIVAHG